MCNLNLKMNLQLNFHTLKQKYHISTVYMYIYIYIYNNSVLSAGIQGDDNLQSMLVGTVMRKIKSRTWKKQRYFRLQDDCMTIWYKSKKAGNTHSTCKDAWFADVMDICDQTLSPTWQFWLHMVPLIIQDITPFFKAPCYRWEREKLWR